MRLSKQIGIAVLAGTVVELILVTPLLLVSGRLGLGPLPQWVRALQTFQLPGAPLVERLVRTEGGKLLAVRSPDHWVAYLQLLAMFFQATMFAIIVLLALNLYGRRKAGSSP